MNRFTTVAGLCVAVAGLATPAQGQDCTEFLIQGEFEDYCMQHGKLIKGIEDFEESNVPPGAGMKVALPAPLRGNVPNVDAAGFGFPDGLAEKNLIIQDNVFPDPNPPSPDPSGSPHALYVLGTGAPYNANSKKVGEDLFNEVPPINASLDLIFTDPNHTGIGFELSRFGDPPFGGWHISVYDMADTEIGKFMVPAPPTAEPSKSFWGIWCDVPIGRINIWDEDSPAPDAIDNIQMWMEQTPVCPCDCAIPRNKAVDVVDFLALLAQWGTPGSCDCAQPPNGVVDVVDFLALLAAWGPCPTPINDECTSQEPIDKTDPEGTTTVHFDMYGATPSPEPYKCLADNPTHKDTWYCLTNATGQTVGVTITTNIQLYIEVNDGCGCPPGPVIACGEGPLGTEQFPMDPGQQVLIRLIDWLDLPNDGLKGSMFISNKVIFDGVNFFDDPGLFDEEIAAQGKFSKGSWAFKPDYVPAGTAPIPVDDILDINTHPVNAPDVWITAGGDDLWPPEIDNVQFSSNLNPQGTLQPAGTAGMAYLKPGSVPDIDNNALTEANDVDLVASFDIISGPPAGDNHTAMALELVSWDYNGIDDVVDIHITVFDKNEQVIGTHLVSGMQPFPKAFVGIVTKDPSITIGRVDIWDEWCSHEGISFIELFYQEPPPQVNFFTDEALFRDEIDAQGKFSKGSWAFKPDYIPVGTPPLLVDDILDITTHQINAPGVWWDGQVDLWPPEIDNVQFSSNVNPQGTFQPYGLGGMAYLKPGAVPDIDNNALTEAVEDVIASFDIISGPPANDNHTAMALELVSWDYNGINDPVVMHISVYDKNEMEIGKFLLTGVQPFPKQFLGIVTKDPSVTIGRVDIWDETCSHEGISFIELFQQEPPPPVNFFTDLDEFYAAINDAGKIDKFNWDFSPHDDPTGFVTLGDPLDITTHGANTNDPWTDDAGNDLWPGTVDNVQFSANMTPRQPLTPRGVDGLVFDVHSAANNLLQANHLEDSFDIISGLPFGANHTGLAMEIYMDGGPIPSPIHITVYDKADMEMGELVITYQGAKAFVGILTKDPDITIGRVDIWAESSGWEGVSWISAFWQPPAAPRLRAFNGP
ncbi:MAG: hypothetical protein ACYS1B_13360 [Planctomycetota bacterium]|jgi:hypothetical protein